MYKGSPFSTSWPILVPCCLFDDSQNESWIRMSQNQCEVLWFPFFISLMISDVEHLFIFLLAIYMTFLEKSPIRSVHFLREFFVLFFMLSCINSLHILDINPLIGYMTYKHLLPFSSLSFHFVNSFLHRGKLLSLVVVLCESLSHVWLFAMPWTVACQAPLIMEFSKQEYGSGLPFPSPGDFPNSRIESASPALQVDSLPPEPPVKPWVWTSPICLLWLLFLLPEEADQNTYW